VLTIAPLSITLHVHACVRALHQVTACLVQSLAERDEFATEVAVLKINNRRSEFAEADSGAKRRRAQTEVCTHVFVLEHRTLLFLLFM
jgi:chorismate mutase